MAYHVASVEGVAPDLGASTERVDGVQVHQDGEIPVCHKAAVVKGVVHVPVLRFRTHRSEHCIKLFVYVVVDEIALSWLQNYENWVCSIKFCALI